MTGQALFQNKFKPMTMKAIIIDDEKDAVISMEIALREYCPEITVIGTAGSAKDGLAEIQSKQPDVVFLDIQMPHMSGIELLESFGNERNFEVVFVTAFNDFAVKAFRLSTTDYLLKPVNIVDLMSAVKRLASRQNATLSVSDRVKKLQAALSGKLAVATASGMEFIPLNEIIHLQAEGSYTRLFCTGRKSLLVSRNLKEFQTSLEGEPFFRTHKSHLINFEHIKKYSPTRDGGSVEMSDGAIVDVARAHKAELAGILDRFVR
jgi:two-component system LytT family response regulator